MEHVYDMWNIALNRKHIIQVKFRLKIAKVGVSLGLVWSPKPTLAQSSSMQAGGYNVSLLIQWSYMWINMI
jgi:hypothetical protein